MNASLDIITLPRSGLRRLIPPWEYHHLRTWASMHITGGVIRIAIAVVLFSAGFADWGVPMLVLAALGFAVGSWELTIVKSAALRSQLATKIS